MLYFLSISVLISIPLQTPLTLIPLGLAIYVELCVLGN